MHLLFPEHGHLLVAAAAPGREPAWRRAAVTCTSLALNRAGDNGASRAGRVRLPKQWQAGETHGILACVRYRPVQGFQQMARDLEVSLSLLESTAGSLSMLIATAFSDLVQAGRWRPVPDDLATTGVTLRQPGE